MSGVPACTMRSALADPLLLGLALPGPSWRPWRTLLIAMMGEPLDDEERAIFLQFTGRPHEPNVRVDELWAILGRRGGKSRAAAVLAIYFALLVNYANVSSLGERLVVLCLAQTTKQAGIVLGYISGLLHAMPLLAGEIKYESSDTITLANGVTIEVRPASWRGLRGISMAAVIADELAFWYTDDAGSKNPDSEILDAVRPGLGTTGGPLIAISSPYAKKGELYEVR
jgi:hypothetical protein